MRQLDPNHPFHKVSGGTYEYFPSMDMDNLLKSVEKVDDHTVKFTLSAPQAPFIANLAMDFASIMSAEYAEQMMEAGTPEKLDLEPVGTGPFQLVDYQKDAVIRYKANADYWARQVARSTIWCSRSRPTPSVRYQKLKAGECQVMAYPNPADIPAMKEDPAVNLMSQEGLNIGYLAYNTEKKPFDDPRVRKALNMAVNKAAIIDAVFQGAGEAAKNPIPPTIWSYNDAIEDDPYDPEAAKKLLAEAGVSGPQDQYLGDAGAAALQPERQADGRADPGRLEGRRRRCRDRQLRVGRVPQALARPASTRRCCWAGPATIGDPDNFLFALLSCEAVKGNNNRARWCNQEFNDLITKAQRVQRPSPSGPSSTRRRRSSSSARRPGTRSRTRWSTSRCARRCVDYKIDPFGTQTSSTASTSRAELAGERVRPADVAQRLEATEHAPGPGRAAPRRASSYQRRSTASTV